MIVVNFGGGKNSTALIIAAVRRGIRPDLVLFADTDGEKPETYAHIRAFSAWLEAHGLAPVVTVRNQRKDGIGSLEDESLKKHDLPSKAYGFPSCSVKWKIDPQDKYLNNHSGLRAIWAAGERAERWLGFHADEPNRAQKRLARDATDPKWLYRYPLVEWDIGQEECVSILAEEGFSNVEKSSCFFCPSMKKWEIRRLARRHPDLLARALHIEANAQVNLRSIPGLGRSFAWADYLRQPELPFESCAMDDEGACDSCYDGE